MQKFKDRNPVIILGILACLILAGIPVAMAANDAIEAVPFGGTILVMTFPPNASVFLNGEYRGVAPLTVDRIPPGKYLVNISLTGYRDESFNIVLINGSRREIGVNLESVNVSAPQKNAGSGSVAVHSSPGGASVLLDGTPAGKTPEGKASLVLNNVAAGAHVVSVELAGYKGYTSTVTVVKNQVVRVSADFIQDTTAQLVTPQDSVPSTPRESTVPTSRSTKPAPISTFAAVTAMGLGALVFVMRNA